MFNPQSIPFLQIGFNPQGIGVPAFGGAGWGGAGNGSAGAAWSPPQAPFGLQPHHLQHQGQYPLQQLAQYHYLVAQQLAQLATQQTTPGVGAGGHHIPGQPGASTLSARDRCHHCKSRCPARPWRHANAICRRGDIGDRTRESFVAVVVPSAASSGCNAGGKLAGLNHWRATPASCVKSVTLLRCLTGACAYYSRRRSRAPDSTRTSALSGHPSAAPPSRTV